MSTTDTDFEVLMSSESTLTQIMQAVVNIEKEHHARSLSVGISSSVTVELLGIFLRRHALLHGTRIEITQGNFDDPIGDVSQFLSAGVEQMVLIPFFDQLLPFFESQVDSLPPEALDAKETEIRRRYRLVFEKAKPMSVVHMGTFHRIGQSADISGNDAVTAVLARFNSALRDEASVFSNVRMVDTEDLVRTVGRDKAFDMRFYFNAMAPYSGNYLNEFARRVAAVERGFGAYYYKVLVLDCDNTLWGGIVGEDLIAGLKLGPFDYPGNIYWRVQHELAAMERNGILLCLCSKNNPADVDEVFRSHPGMVLRTEQIAVKKVNWNDKPSNLRDIAKELNLGLDSIVFLDDSSFECEAVHRQLPMVKTLQVPKRLSDYPKVILQIAELFQTSAISPDNRSKTGQYRQLAAAAEIRADFDTQEAYLESLDLEVDLTRNDRTNIQRISELSMKSNQFNLTTKRYSQADIEQLMAAEDCAVYSLVVRDKFGISGLTGVVVMRFVGTSAHVENFYMSCRVLGRGVEMSIWTRIASVAAARGCSHLHSTFIPSSKNAQVADFYDRLGMAPVGETGNGCKKYSIDLKFFSPPASPWINLTYVE